MFLITTIYLSTVLMNPPLLTVNDVATYLGMSPQNVYALAKGEKIPHYKIGGKSIRFKEDEVERWVNSQKINILSN